MTAYRRYIAAAVIYYICLCALIYAVGLKISSGKSDNRAVFMNRMTAIISETGNTDTTPLQGEFKSSEIASSIEVFYLDGTDGRPFYGGGDDNTYIWSLTDPEGDLTGFVKYGYEDRPDMGMIILALAAVPLAAVPLIVFAAGVNRKVLVPFRKFADYPARLSKGQTTEGLPETRDRLFGKYVWGMNMLNDKLESDRKQIDRLLYERKNFISTLAHGIKTPVANIKLYSEAIETGLYRDGKPDPKDSEIAGKIGKNAEEIGRIVGEILDDPGSLQSSFSPDIGTFYLRDIKARLEDDFDNRLKIRDIPFNIEMSGDPMVSSDFEAIIRCLTQFMENAIKYGDGTGIKVKLYRQDDLTFMSVVNNGVTLSEGEIPFVFNCYFRGSNSAGKEGSGIGLYEARTIARALGGDIMMKTGGGCTEVIMYI